VSDRLILARRFNAGANKPPELNVASATFEPANFSTVANATPTKSRRSFPGVETPG
jgi:hypothetical protein